MKVIKVVHIFRGAVKNGEKLLWLLVRQRAASAKLFFSKTIKVRIKKTVVLLI